MASRVSVLLMIVVGILFAAIFSAQVTQAAQIDPDEEERIQKFIHTAFFWPVEVGKILMRLLIVILNKLVRIISRRNRLVSKIALGDHLVRWSSIRGSIFRRIGYVLRGTFVFLTRARARGVR